MKVKEMIPASKHSKDREPIVRILNHILMQAMWQDTREIYLKPCPEEPEKKYLIYFMVHIVIPVPHARPIEEIRFQYGIPQSIIDPIIERLRVMGDVSDEVATGRIDVRMRDDSIGFALNYNLWFEIIPTGSGQPQITLRIEYL